jgi:hypothetical protein
MGHKNEYLVRLSDNFRTEECMLGNVTIESGKYEGSGYYRMIHAESFEEAIEKWNNNDCPDELKRIWGECGVNESLVMVINHKGYVKYYM